MVYKSHLNIVVVVRFDIYTHTHVHVHTDIFIQHIQELLTHIQTLLNDKQKNIVIEKIIL